MTAASPHEMPATPGAPAASPIYGLVDPLGGFPDPKLTTPAWPSAPGSDDWPTGFVGFEQISFDEFSFDESSPFGHFDSFGKQPIFLDTKEELPGFFQVSNDLAQIDAWAWELGSEFGSLAPSAWSASTKMTASTKRSSATSLSTAGATVPGFPGLMEGQRLQCVKPGSLPPSGGTVMVGLRKQIPQGYWDQVEIMLVAGTQQVKLKPSGIKKGKKLCIEVPADLTPQDYDVRVVFSGKVLHGAIPLAVRTDTESEDENETAENPQD